MAKTLKLFNGRGQGRERDRLYIAAYSRADAARMMAEKYSHTMSSGQRELKLYFAECWGNPMKGIEPKRGMWTIADRGNEAPVLIHDGEDSK